MSESRVHIEEVAWSLIDCLRGPMSLRDYDVLLFLLTAYRDGLLSESHFVENGGRVNLSEYFSRIKYATSYGGPDEDLTSPTMVPLSWEVYNAFEGSLQQINSRTLHDIFNILERIDRQFFDDHFAALFDVLLNKINESQRSFGGGFLQPNELTQLMLGITEIPAHGSVYNPFAGVNSFGIALNDQHCFAQEINAKTWAIGVLRLRAHNRLKNFTYLKQDSIDCWPLEEQKFDLIISNPPFGVRIQRYLFPSNSPIRQLEQFLISKGVESLNDSGKLIAALPHGILFRSNYDEHLRKTLVERDLIEMIISLPGGLLSYTSIPIAILLLNKDKAQPGHITMVDGSNFITTKSGREKILDHKGLLRAIGEKDNRTVRNISTQKVVKENYNLSVLRYFQQPIEVSDGWEVVKLGDYLKPLKASRMVLPDEARFVRVRDLSDDTFDYRLNPEEIKKDETLRNSPRVKYIDQSCLLVANNWNNLKPTFFEYEGSPIYISNDIAAFWVDSSKVDLAYLINELHADYVKDQVEKYKTGTVVPRISEKDFLSIQVKFPDLDKQRAKAQGIQEISQKIKALEREKQALVAGQEKTIYEQSASLKHALGKPILNINSGIRLLEKTLSKNMPNWREIPLSEESSITLSNTVEAIKSNLEQVHNLLERNANEFDVNNYKLQSLDIVQFLKSYVRSLKASDTRNMKVDIREDNDIKQYFNSKVIIDGNKQLLKILFDNLVDNAWRHGFLEDNKDHRITIDLELFWSDSDKEAKEEFLPVLSDIRINVANNGEPFPESFGKEKYIKKNFKAGSTGNTGEGGYQVNEIIKYLNNGSSTLHIETLIGSTPDDFITNIFFSFPIINAPKQ